MTEQQAVGYAEERINGLTDPFTRMVAAAFTDKLEDDPSKAQFISDAAEVFPGLELGADALHFGGYSGQTHIIRGLTHADPANLLVLTNRLARNAGRASSDYKFAKDLRALRLIEKGVWTADDVAVSRKILSKFAGRIITRTGKA